MVKIFWLVDEPRTRDVIPAVFFLNGHGHESRLCSSIDDVFTSMSLVDDKIVVVITSMLETYTYSPWVWSKKREIYWHGVDYARKLLETSRDPAREIRMYIIHPCGNASLSDPHEGSRNIVESLGGIVTESMQLAVESILASFTTSNIPSPIRRARPVYRFVIARHGQRLDEVWSHWWKTAERPQDTPISATGKLQSIELGKWVSKRPWRTQVSKVFSSPFLRAVQTADLAAGALGLSENSICIENGLCEGAQWMEGNGLSRKPWFLRAGDFYGISDKIDLTYQSVKDPIFTEGSIYPGRPIEEEEFYDRCAATIWRLARAPALSNTTILIVTHAGCVMNFTHALSGRVLKNVLHTSVTILKTNGMGGYEIQSELLPENSSPTEYTCSRAHLTENLLT